MSVINQVLQDLEKRRASGAERAGISKYVRALPREGRALPMWWIAGGVAAAIMVAGAGAWYLQRARPPAQTVVPAAPVPLEISAQMPPLVIAREEPRADPRAVPPEPIPTSALVAARPAVEPAPALREPEPRRTLKPADESPPLAAPEPPRAAARAPRPVAAGEGGEKPLAAVAAPHIDKRVPQPTATQLAETDYRDGTTLLHQGRIAEAHEKYRSALYHVPGHASARQGLFGLLLDAKRMAEAEQVLREGLAVNIAQPRFAMALARMQVDRGDTAGALETLHKSASSALGSADYIAFFAALLQRQSRHAEAVDHYLTALSLVPGSAIWSMGLGISLQALNRTQEARDSFRRALAANALSPALQAFVDQRLKQLQ